MSDRQSVAANTTIANVLVGKSQEFLTRPSVLRFGLTASAVGLFTTIIVGNEVICEDQEISSANRSPLDPDDYNYEASGMPGDRVIVKLRNSTAGALTGFTGVKVTPLA